MSKESPTDNRPFTPDQVNKCVRGVGGGGGVMSDVQYIREDVCWNEAFAFAGHEDTCDGAQCRPLPVPGFGGETGPARPSDVVRVIAYSDGEHDGREWVGAFELADGRFLALRAWCDYTGWD